MQFNANDCLDCIFQQSGDAHEFPCHLSPKTSFAVNKKPAIQTNMLDFQKRLLSGVKASGATIDS